MAASTETRMKAFLEIELRGKKDSGFIAVEKSVKGMTGALDESTAAQKRGTSSTKEGTRSRTRFNMAALSGMFLMQGLSKAMEGIATAGREVMGVNEIWNDSFELLMQDYNEFLLGAGENFLDWVEGLPEPMRNAIGWFIGLGFEVSKLAGLLFSLAVAGSAGLFFAGGVTAVATLTTQVGAAVLAFLSLGAAIVAAGAALGIGALVGEGLSGFFEDTGVSDIVSQTGAFKALSGIPVIGQGLGSLVGGAQASLEGLAGIGGRVINNTFNLLPVSAEPAAFVGASAGNQIRIR